MYYDRIQNLRAGTTYPKTQFQTSIQSQEIKVTKVLRMEILVPD